MTDQERDELARLKQIEAAEKQREFEAKMAPAFDLWRRMQERDPSLK